MGVFAIQRSCGKCRGKDDVGEGFLPPPNPLRSFPIFVTQEIYGISFTLARAEGELFFYDYGMRVRIKGMGSHGTILDENGDLKRTRRSIVLAAKELRQRMTPAEKILWEKLRHKKLCGLRFYRQVPIDQFIVDFYCPAKKLVIEIDGSIHDESDTAEHDEDREECFRAKGLRVFRFRNEDVMENLPMVCDSVSRACEARLN